MNNDLISREALKKAIDEEFYREEYFQRKLEISEKVFNQGLSTALDLIQSAPTVEPCYQTTSCLDCKMYDKENHHCPRFCEVIRELVKETENEGL